jgi:hypothetical protein
MLVRRPADLTARLRIYHLERDGALIAPSLFTKLIQSAPSWTRLVRTVRAYGGREVPALPLTIATSPALIAPFEFTSVRKFPAPTGTPDCPLVWAASPALTAPLALVSPDNTPIGIMTSPALFTFMSVTPNR